MEDEGDGSDDERRAKHQAVAGYHRQRPLPDCVELFAPRRVHQLEELALPRKELDDADLADHFGRQLEALVGCREEALLVQVEEGRDAALERDEEGEDGDPDCRARPKEVKQEVADQDDRERHLGREEVKVGADFREPERVDADQVDDLAR